MRRTAQRLRGGEILAIEAGRARRLPGADVIDWLAGGPRVGVVVELGNTVRLAEPHEQIHTYPKGAHSLGGGGTLAW